MALAAGLAGGGLTGLFVKAHKPAPDLGALDSAWRGWTMVRGELVSPDGLRVRPGEIASIPLREQLVAALRAELRPYSQRALF